MRFTFTGECRHPEQQIHSCQNVGSQFLIANQKFNITYKQCQGMDWTANKGNERTIKNHGILKILSFFNRLIFEFIEFHLFFHL